MSSDRPKDFCSMLHASWCPSRSAPCGGSQTCQGLVCASLSHLLVCGHHLVLVLSEQWELTCPCAEELGDCLRSGEYRKGSNKPPLCKGWKALRPPAFSRRTQGCLHIVSLQRKVWDLEFTPVIEVRSNCACFPLVGQLQEYK